MGACGETEEKGVLGLRRFQRNTSNAPKTTIEQNLLHIILVVEPQKNLGEESNPLVHRAFWHGSAGKDSITQYTYFISGNTTHPPTAESPFGLRFNSLLVPTALPAYGFWWEWEEFRKGKGKAQLHFRHYMHGSGIRGRLLLKILRGHHHGHGIGSMSMREGERGFGSLGLELNCSGGNDTRNGSIKGRASEWRDIICCINTRTQPRFKRNPIFFVLSRIKKQKKTHFFSSLFSTGLPAVVSLMFSFVLSSLDLLVEIYTYLWLCEV